MVTTKIFYFRFNQRRIGTILNTLEKRFINLSITNDMKIRKLQRFYYFQESILFFLNYFNGFMLSMSFPFMVNISLRLRFDLFSIIFVCFGWQAALQSQKILPHRATFPFNTSNDSGYKIAYWFQTITFTYLIHGIVFVDNIGVCTLNESLLHIQVVSHKFKQLYRQPFDTTGKKSNEQLITCIKEHQEIIRYIQQ